MSQFDNQKQPFVPASGLADHQIGGHELRLGHLKLLHRWLVGTGLRVARAALLGPRLTTILIDLPIWMPQKRSRSAVGTHMPFLPP